MLYTIKEVARMLGVSYWTLREWVRDGRIGSVLVGDQRRIQESDLAAYLGSPERARALIDEWEARKSSADAA